MRTHVRSLDPLSKLRIQCCCELWCRSQTRLRTVIAVAVACSCSSDLTPSLRTAICCTSTSWKWASSPKKRTLSYIRGPSLLSPACCWVGKCWGSRTPPMTGVLAIASVTAGSCSPPGRGGQGTVGDGSVLCAPFQTLCIPAIWGRQAVPGKSPWLQMRHLACVARGHLWARWPKSSLEHTAPYPPLKNALQTKHIGCTIVRAVSLRYDVCDLEKGYSLPCSYRNIPWFGKEKNPD